MLRLKKKKHQCTQTQPPRHYTQFYDDYIQNKNAYIGIYYYSQAVLFYRHVLSYYLATLISFSISELLRLILAPI